MTICDFCSVTEKCVYILISLFSVHKTNVNLGFWIPSLAFMAENLIESFSIIIIIILNLNSV